MPLDPRLRPLLERIHAQPRPDDGHLPVPQRRAARQSALDGLLTVVDERPAEISATSDVDIAVDGGRITVRLYQPNGSPPLPAIVFLHGGAWWLGTLDLVDSLCHRLCTSGGAVIVNVDYRRAPEHPFPVPWQDGAAALAWVAQHADELGVDRTRISVGGQSAGANLAVAVALGERDRGRAGIASLVLCEPALDATMDSPSIAAFGEDFFLTAAGLRQGWEFYLSCSEDAGRPYASPFQAPNLAGLPPTLIVTAEFDPLRDEGEEFGRRLAAAGVATQVSRYPGMIHGFELMTRIVPEAQACIEEMADFVRTQGGIQC